MSSGCARLVDAGRIEIDTGDVRHGPPQFTGEHALAAADVESAPGAIGNRSEDPGAVVDVVVPSPVALHWHVITLPDTTARLGPLGVDNSQ